MASIGRMKNYAKQMRENTPSKSGKTFPNKPGTPHGERLLKLEERVRRLEAENRELRELWSQTESRMVTDSCEIQERLHSFNKDLRRIIRAIDKLSGGKDVWKKGEKEKKGKKKKK